MVNHGKACEVQDSIIASLIFYNDQTSLSNDRRVFGYPIYMSLTNIPYEKLTSSTRHQFIAIFPILTNSSIWPSFYNLKLNRVSFKYLTLQRLFLITRLNFLDNRGETNTHANFNDFPWMSINHFGKNKSLQQIISSYQPFWDVVITEILITWYY